MRVEMRMRMRMRARVRVKVRDRMTVGCVLTMIGSSSPSGLNGLHMPSGPDGSDGGGK